LPVGWRSSGFELIGKDGLPEIKAGATVHFLGQEAAHHVKKRADTLLELLRLGPRLFSNPLSPLKVASREPKLAAPTLPVGPMVSFKNMESLAFTW
jgi:hypothetical protein